MNLFRRLIEKARQLFGGKAQAGAGGAISQPGASPYVDPLSPPLRPVSRGAAYPPDELPGGPPVPPAPPRDPRSNAPPGYPDRDPSGLYPLWYALDGSGLPIGAPRLIYDGQTFANAAEVQSYVWALADRNGQPAPEDVGGWGPHPFATLADADFAYIAYLSNHRNDTMLANKVVSGSPAQLDYAKSRGEALRIGFDPAAYAGPLKDRI